ncbi:MAG: response regulator, partial [Desulfobacterales bacterium]|nr:response regulator [Desulfobacterales bacterium]
LAIIGISAQGAGALSAQFLKRGANDFLIKPFLNEEFYCRIIQNIEYIEMMEAARENLNMKNKFLGIVAHDLRNPIASIEGFSDICLSESFGPLSDEYKEYMRILNKTSRNMLSLVNDLLDVSVIESGKFELRLQRESLKKLLSERIRINEILAKRKNIAIHKDFADVPETLFDSSRIAQVIDNLVGNAIKFSPTGANIHVGLTQEGDRANVYVRDEGPGISEEEQAHLFEDFKRSIAMATAGEKSSGLGLAIAKRIIESHKGKLEARGRKGRGATFSFSLPMKDAPPLGAGEAAGGVAMDAVETRTEAPGPKADAQPVQTPGEAAADAAPPPGSTPPEALPPLHILVADDSLANRRIIEYHLRETPYHVDAADNGVIAFTKFTSGRYDIVLMDIEMPVMDGYGAVKNIRQWEKEKGAAPTPIVALTGHKGEEFERKSIQAGFSDRINKPIKKQILLETISRCTREKKPDRARETDKAASRAKSAFLAGVSHEIRTPMNAIMGMTDLLEETALNDEQKKFVYTIRYAGENLLCILGDILDIARMEAEQFSIDRHFFDLHETLEKTIEVMGLSAREKGLALTVSFGPRAPKGLFGDSKRLRQVLVNLIGNAIKFTGKGEIKVTVDARKTGDAEVDLIFSVKDTGIGIPDEKLAVIFENFSQADSSATRAHGGAGLGLSISRRIVESMGGQIRVESKEGEGSVFFFTAKFGVDREYRKSVKPAKVQLKGVKVLVMEDARTDRMILTHALAGWGASVTDIADGASGLAEYGRAKEAGDPYNLVLLDYQMPGMDGLEVAEKINNDVSHKVPIILISSTEIISSRVRELGIARHMTKPVKKADLRATISFILEKNKIMRKKQAARARIAAADRPLKILLVDDTEDNRMLILAYLKKTPHETEIAENGEVAVKKFKTGEYDLVLMDVEMPVMDGYSATEAIREWEKENAREPTPIVALTAHALKEHEQHSIEAGCNGHVTKPIKKAKLLDTIHAYAAGSA